MRAPVTVELYLDADAEDVARALSPGVEAGDLTVVPTGSWHLVPWTRRLHAWRRVGDWQRGGHGGRMSIDLVPAGPARTLAVVTLSPAPGWRRTGLAAADAGAVASALRGAVQRGTTAAVPAAAEPSVLVTPARRPARAAV